ncbi:hypothetical protein AGMMS49579_06480 [Spirochaetia bacterium]|nr:hypothetical protein AGMMS49579_06480 [Spirochaetia bacterium]
MMHLVRESRRPLRERGEIALNRAIWLLESEGYHVEPLEEADFEIEQAIRLVEQSGYMVEE